MSGISTVSVSDHRDGRRVLLISTGLSAGGAERQVVELAERFAKLGLRPAIMSLVSNGTYLKQRILSAGIPLFELGMRPGRASLRGLWRAIKIVRCFKPEIIHSHMFHANLLARVLRLFVRVPAIVCTAHNSNEGGRANMLLYRVTHCLASRTTNVSAIAARELERRGAAPKGAIIPVPNGIDIERFYSDPNSRRQVRGELGIGGSTFVFLAIGRLTLQKDYGNFLRAARTLVDSCTEVKFLIAGSGEQKSSLESLCGELRLDPYVVWLGERHDVHRILNAADGFVLSSAYEGFGLVVAEAMATEIPVITTASSGPEEVVADAGHVVPVGDSIALAEAMRKVMSLQTQERLRLVKRAKQRVVENYTIDASVKRWLDIYTQVLTD